MLVLFSVVRKWTKFAKFFQYGNLSNLIYEKGPENSELF